MGGTEDYNKIKRRGLEDTMDKTEEYVCVEELQNILLCRECYKENQYIIPNFLIDTNNNEIEYECYKHGILKEDNIFYFKAWKIKDKLNECQIHKEMKFCAWCKICNKNICHSCFPEELKNNHNYILYNSLLTENEVDKFVKNKLINLKKYYEEIKIYYKDVDKYEKKIILLHKIIQSIEYYYNLFFNKNIINYQIVFGLRNTMKILMDNYNEYEYMYNNKYSLFLSFIKGKEIKDLNQLKVSFPEKYRILDTLIFNTELFDEESDINNRNKGYNKVIFLYCLNSKNKRCILIYNMEGNLLKSIDYDFEGRKLLKFIQYKSNILIIFNSENIIYYFTFYIFSSDFKDYETKKIEINFSILNDDNLVNVANIYKNIPICSFTNGPNIFKIENNKILLFFSYTRYVLKINDASIFNNSIYYKDNNLKKDTNMEKQIELIHNFKYYLNVIPIYNTNIDNKGILNFIALSFDSELAPEYELLLTQDEPHTFISKPENNEPNYLYLGKYMVKLKNFTTNDYFHKYYETFLEFCMQKLIWGSALTTISKIKIYGKLTKFDNEFEIQNLSKFPLCLNDTLNLMKINNTHCELVYCYSKKYLLLLLNNTIYQINNNTGEAITIYELDINIFTNNIFDNTKDIMNNNTNKENILSQYYILRIIHYFNKDLRKFEELLLLTNTFSESYIYPYFWNLDEIEQIKPFRLPDLKNIYEVNFFESSNNILQDSLDMERILVDTDGITIFK